MFRKNQVLMNEVEGQTTAGAPATPGALAQSAQQAVAASKKATRKPKAGKKAKVVKKAKLAPKKVSKKGATGLVNKKIRPAYVKQYRKGKKGEKTAGGNLPIDCNDRIAQSLRGRDIEYVYKEVAKAAEVPVAELKRRYSKLNLGLQRMSLGNVLRGALS